MNKILTAIALSLVANGAFATGFSPWNEQTAKVDLIDKASAHVSPAGFGPWRERNIEDVRTIDKEFVLDYPATNIFRPWS